MRPLLFAAVEFCWHKRDSRQSDSLVTLDFHLPPRLMIVLYGSHRNPDLNSNAEIITEISD